jgi:hypothetical protein
MVRPCTSRPGRNGIRLRACAVYVSGHRCAAHQRAGYWVANAGSGNMTGGRGRRTETRAGAGMQSARIGGLGNANVARLEGLSGTRRSGTERNDWTNCRARRS